MSHHEQTSGSIVLDTVRIGDQLAQQLIPALSAIEANQKTAIGLMTAQALGEEETAVILHSTVPSWEENPNRLVDHMAAALAAQGWGLIAIGAPALPSSPAVALTEVTDSLPVVQRREQMADRELRESDFFTSTRDL